MPLRFNANHTRQLSTNTLEVAIDADHREELDNQQARDLALQQAGQYGFGNAGLSENPIIGAVNAATGEIADGAEALDPALQRNGWRGIFKINKRQ